MFTIVFILTELDSHQPEHRISKVSSLLFLLVVTRGIRSFFFFLAHNKSFHFFPSCRVDEITGRLRNVLEEGEMVTKSVEPQFKNVVMKTG